MSLPSKGLINKTLKAFVLGQLVQRNLNATKPTNLSFDQLFFSFAVLPAELEVEHVPDFQFWRVAIGTEFLI